ncbi:SNF2 family N-terminal domain-containing protein [Helicostylum pulchrum]|nr:SNF2 family N-terminal domain-containing protein [Helicostylum pulchrum]
MSKRSRDETKIEFVRSILGDIPIETIEKLLNSANQNVETAINLYFTDPSPPPPVAQSVQHIKQDKPAQAINKYYIGDLVITAWSLTKGQSPVKEGDKVNIVRDNVINSSNKIVRFSIKGKEIGRLPKEVADYISTLIDFKLCTFEGTIVWCPSTLKMGDDMILMIQCYLSPIRSENFTTTLPTPKKRSIQKNVDVNVLKKMALMRMFRNLALKPVRSSIQRMNVDGDDTWDMLLQTVAQKEVVVEEGEEEKKEVTDDQLDSIYEKAQVFDSHITAMDQPETMALELKEYQKRALAWMTAKETWEHEDGDIDMRSMHPLWEEYAFPNECDSEYKFFYFNPYSGELSLEFPEASTQERGGILADEILSLIHANRFNKHKDPIPQSLSSSGLLGKKSKRSVKKSPTTLIVCPMSLLAQWRDEIIRGSKPGTIKVDVFYGEERSKSTVDRLSSWTGSAPDVLVTTYGCILTDWTKLQNNNAYESPLFGIEFWRVVLDEAHQIKNRASKTSLACSDIKSRRRWAVSGTPIQNKLDDLYSLVRFLKHEPWANHTFWRTFITVPFEKQDPRALTAVQSVLEPIVLRRTKAMRDRNGQPMVPLPPKTVSVEYLSFSPEEQDIYDAIYSDSQIKFSYFCEAGKVGANYASILQLLTKLRQSCCHPYLALKNIVTDRNTKGINLEDLIANRNNAMECSQDELYPQENKYGLSVLQSMLDLQKGSLQNNAKDSQESSLDALAKINDECPICFESPDTMIALPCMHLACRLCVMDYFQKKEDEGAAGECPVCRHGPILQSQLLEIAVKPVDQMTESNVAFDIRKAVGGFRPSTKMNALIAHLKQDQADHCKTVVFSQFTSFLDLIGEALEHENIEFTRLDGTLQQAQREKVLNTFADEGKNVNVILISLRAGGVGLNLTCASRVVMMDPWWNLSIEAQAIDRVHRLGQLKDVSVTRFVVRDTIEERILEIQNRKNVLVNELYQSRDESKNRKMADLKLLFSKSARI